MENLFLFLFKQVNHICKYLESMSVVYIWHKKLIIYSSASGKGMEIKLRLGDEHYLEIDKKGTGAMPWPATES